MGWFLLFLSELSLMVKTDLRCFCFLVCLEQRKHKVITNRETHQRAAVAVEDEIEEVVVEEKVEEVKVEEEEGEEGVEIEVEVDANVGEAFHPAANCRSSPEAHFGASPGGSCHDGEMWLALHRLRFCPGLRLFGNRRFLVSGRFCW